MSMCEFEDSSIMEEQRYSSKERYHVNYGHGDNMKITLATMGKDEEASMVSIENRYKEKEPVEVAYVVV